MRILRVTLRPLRAAKKTAASVWSGWTGKIVDLHVYGGLILIGAGLWGADGGFALLACGVLLLLLGLRGS